MTGPRHDEIELLLPWYATSTLPEDERALVEAHLASCATCRDLLAHAHRNVALAETGRASEHLAHVSPRLLTEYVESPDRLDADTRSWIADRLHECGDCRAAHDRLLDVEHALAAPARRPAVVPNTGSWLESAWALLSGTVLRPAPALAYLVLLAFVSVPAIRSMMAPADGGTHGLVSPQLVVVEGARDVRDDAAPVPPLEVRLPADRSRPLLLRLELGHPVSTLAALAGEFRVELRIGRETVFGERRAATDLAEEAERAVLYVLVDPGTVRPDEPHDVAVLAVRPGSAVDGRSVFRRSIVFSR